MTSPANAAPMAQGGIGLAGLGAITTAFGQYNQGESTSAMYGYQAGMADYNAKIDRQNADYTLAAGDGAVQKLGMGQRFQAGKIVASQAASGVDVGSGSA